MGQAVKADKLYFFGVNHHQFELFGGVVEDQTGHNGVDKDRFARPRLPRHEHVRQFRHIGNHGRARHILPNGHAKVALDGTKRGRIEHVPQPHRTHLAIGHFDADKPLARHGGFDTHPRSGQC